MWGDYYFDWGKLWSAYDLVSFITVGIIENCAIGLQTSRAVRTAATVGLIYVPPEKPRPPSGGIETCNRNRN